MNGDFKKVTIVLPSLNPDEKLNKVVDGLLSAGFEDIVLVNDGSDEAHLEPFRQAAAHKEVTLLTHEVNKGKGRALKTAFSYVVDNRKQTAGVITVDGDNQHTVKDIRACAEKMLECKDKVILGCRDFTQDNVPWKSRVGNVSTSLVFRLFCGIKISDTQTGLRAIPYQYLPLMCEVEGERFEYETQMLFAIKKNHIGMEEVKIETVYLEDNASTHFDPIKDSLKIYKIIFKFMISSGTSFLIDYGIYSLLVFLIGGNFSRGLRLFIATFVARAVSSICNYTMNKKAVFKSKASVSRSLIRYYILCVFQTAASYGLVYLLSSLCRAGSFLEIVLKLAVDIVLFIISFQIQHRWVFKEER
jgi:glycosyltransferase involved in cell wall biosynthesis